MEKKDKLDDFIEEMVRTYYDELFKVAKKRIGNIEDAQDILNELWYMATYKAKDLYEHPNKIAWLYTGLNFCIKRYRTRSISRIQKRTENGQMITEIGSIETVPINTHNENKLQYHEEFYNGELFEEFQKILSESEMKYLLSKFRDDLDNKSIAKKEEKSYSAITSLGYRVKEKIKKYLIGT
ncbi:RNA polymerase sigma factor, sigma-70 family [Anaerovirgula multivorans]|uniref:RNA polymerase sigma factor, sigma-70 family n=1 Tax=Anaerovirgula multivorans TaxID=312168 RepID=A0A239GE75_9FIRM|nr:sigma-70 family RNA polymerase sigma factor [Anaerovirgula multivorans]SNS67606.1 RNA polymerase sigma factor, sigma-70 family [Anaerovirgula multivorans]